MEEAEKVVKNLLEKDFRQAKVLTDGKKVRVSLFDTTDRDEALRKLKEAKVNYRDAWLLKQ